MSEPAGREIDAVLVHRLRRTSGRDPREPERVATSLQLLLDLTFAIAFGVACRDMRTCWRRVSSELG